MAYLGIHTATTHTALTLLTDQGFFTETFLRRSAETDNLILTIDHLCQRAAVDFRRLLGIVVTTGPGHYLGIRVGSTTVSMMHAALQIPTYGISTLDALLPATAQGLYWVLLPARKGSWHASLFRVIWQPEAHVQISENSALLGQGWGYTALTAPFVIKEEALSQTLGRFQAPITVCGEISTLPQILENEKTPVRYLDTRVDTARLASLAKQRHLAGMPGEGLRPYYGYDAV